MKYNDYKKRYFIEVLIFIYLLLSVVIILIPFLLVELNKLMWPFALLISLVNILICIVLYKGINKYLSQFGFEQVKLEPYTFNCRKDFESICNILKSLNELFERIDDNIAVGLLMFNTLQIKVNILKFEKLDKESFKKFKRKANKYTNNKYNISQQFNRASELPIKINIVIVDRFDTYADELAGNNAYTLFMRAEPIFNVFISEQEKKCKIPAHFGLVGGGLYKKILKNIIKLLDLSCD